MTELILSDITRMGTGLCVIGLERADSGYRSVRPGPSRGHAWPSKFPYHRGDRLRFQLVPADSPAPPHLEDHRSNGLVKQLGNVSEAELLSCLRQAELARSLQDLFGCPVRVQRRGAFIWPTRARRSICGVDAPRVRLKIEARELRALVGFPSGETAELKVVDRSWEAFLQAALSQLEGVTRSHRLHSFLDAVLARAGREGVFVRVGVTRPSPRRCWLMVDSLFPMPRKSWIAEVVKHDPVLECTGPE